MTAFAAPDGTALLDVVSPRIARVFSTSNPADVLFCKRVEPAYRALPEGTALLRREEEIVARIGRSDAAGAAPRIRASGQDAAGPYLLLEPTPGRLVAAPPLDGASVRVWLGLLFGTLAQLHAARTVADGEPLGLVHGDLSPDNVLCTDSAVAFVDWELGRAKGVGELELGPFRGTLAFVAPEVAEGQRPTQASDVFSLGLVCLQLLAGGAIRKHEGAAGIIEAAETEVDLMTTLANLPPDVADKARPFFAAVLALRPLERPSDGSATLSLLW